MLRADHMTYALKDDGKSTAIMTGQQLYNDDVFFELGTAAGLKSITQISTNCRWCHVKRLSKSQPWRRRDATKRTENLGNMFDSRPLHDVICETKQVNVEANQEGWSKEGAF